MRTSVSEPTVACSRSLLLSASAFKYTAIPKKKSLVRTHTRAYPGVAFRTKTKSKKKKEKAGLYALPATAAGPPAFAPPPLSNHSIAADGDRFARRAMYLQIPKQTSSSPSLGYYYPRNAWHTCVIVFFSTHSAAARGSLASFASAACRALRSSPNRRVRPAAVAVLFSSPTHAHAPPDPVPVFFSPESAEPSLAPPADAAETMSKPAL